MSKAGRLEVRKLPSFQRSNLPTFKLSNIPSFGLS